MSKSVVICEKIHLPGVKLSDLRSPQPHYPYSVILAQIMPEFIQTAPGFPLKQSHSDGYQQKIMKVLECASDSLACLTFVLISFHPWKCFSK